MHPLRPLLALPLLLLAAPPPAQAIIMNVTGYTKGTVSATPTPSATFAAGSTVYLTFGYVFDSVANTASNFESTIWVDPVPGGFSLSIFSTGTGSGSVAGRVVTMDLTNAAGQSLHLFMDGPLGTVSYSRASPPEGFTASLVRIADTTGFPTPEPGGVAMALTGAALAGLWRWRAGR